MDGPRSNNETCHPAIVAHVATGRADAAEHRHVPGTASGIALNSGATRDHRLSRHPWLGFVVRMWIQCSAGKA